MKVNFDATILTIKTNTYTKDNQERTYYTLGLITSNEEVFECGCSEPVATSLIKGKPYTLEFNFNPQLPRCYITEAYLLQD